MAIVLKAERPLAIGIPPVNAEITRSELQAVLPVIMPETKALNWIIG